MLFVLLLAMKVFIFCTSKHQKGAVKLYVWLHSSKYYEGSCLAQLAVSGSKLTMDAQILDVDCVQVGKGAHAAAWLSDLRTNAASYFTSPDAQEICRRTKEKGYAYVVRLWCRTSTGASVCVAVADPWSTSYRKLKSIGGLDSLAKAVQEELNAKAQNVSGMVDVSVVYKKTTNGYIVDPATLLPIRHPWLRIRAVSAYLKSQQTIALRNAQQKCFIEAVFMPLTDAEARVEVHLELMQTIGLRPGGWLHLTSSVWERAETGGCRTHTAFHLQVMRDELNVASVDMEQKISSIRVLSWDIECYSAQHAFPIATNTDDVVIAIGLCSRTLYVEDVKNAREERVVLCLKDVKVPLDTQIKIMSFDNEASLFGAFATYIQQSDADVLVGYNTCGFDWKYIKNRLEVLKEWTSTLNPSEAEAMIRFSRVVRRACPPEEQQLGSAAIGDNPLCYPRTPGRVGVDLWFYLKRENSPDLPNLKLNTVAAHYLGDNKVDLPAKAMFAEYEKGPEGRFVVANYCCQDCMLVLNLIEKLNVLPTLLEMAKVTRTIPEDLLYRGQQIKVYAQLLAAAHEMDDYVVEDPAQTGGREDDMEEEQEKYKGAHVEEPQQGYYLDPVLTVDFASLYPSLMRTYNLSPDTLLPAEVHQEIPHAVLQISPERAPLRFVAASHCRGLLPRILDTLLQERKRVKKAMATEINPFRQQLLNAKQLALKISANSVYGACGATKGLLQCREVAEATTATGRDIIGFTKETIENNFEVKGCKVIYGDSVSADTPLVLRQHGRTRLCCIAEAENKESRWQTRRSGKFETFPEDLQVYSDTGFTNVKRIIKHAYRQPLVQVTTALGSVDCTHDHSLLLLDGSPVTPACLKIGTTALLHAVDDELVKAFACSSADSSIDVPIGAFTLGLFFRFGACGLFKTTSNNKSAAWHLTLRSDSNVVHRAKADLPFPVKSRPGRNYEEIKLVPEDSHLKEAVVSFRELYYNSRGQRQVPPHIFSMKRDVLVQFWEGCTQNLPLVTVCGKLAAAGLWIVGRMLGFTLRMQTPRGRPGWYDLRVCNTNASPFRKQTVLSKKSLPPKDIEFVYDLETDSHHFHVAPGDMVVHNTDSAFVRLPETHRYVSEEVLFQLGEDMAKQVTVAFKMGLEESLQTHCAVLLEMEKYLKPLILYKKKRYVGIAYEEIGKKGKVLAKGIELVRRDAVPLVRSSQAQVIEALLERQSPTQAVASVKEAVRVVQAIPPGGPFTQVVLSKSLKQNYASPDAMPHVKVANLMNTRDAGSAPRVGDRVEYVVIASESSRVVDRVEDIGYAMRENLPPDWYFYVEALERPLLRILEVPLTDTAPDLHKDLQNFFKTEKEKALRQRQKHSHARHGAHWVEGLACKKGNGLPQRKLEFFGFATPTVQSGESTTTSSKLPNVSVIDTSYTKQSEDKSASASVFQQNTTLGTASLNKTTTGPVTRGRPKAQSQGAHGKRACTALLAGSEPRTKMRQTTL